MVNNAIGVYIFQTISAITLGSAAFFYTSHQRSLDGITNVWMIGEWYDFTLDYPTFEEMSTQILASLTGNYLSYPWFVFGFIIFLLTTGFSFLTLTYLGLYGVFILNLLALVFM